MTRAPCAPTLVETGFRGRGGLHEHDRLPAGERTHRACVLRRPARRPGRRPLRRGPHAVQRDDRQAPGADRLLHERRRRGGRDPLRARPRPVARRPRRRPQRRRPRERRRRRRDRPVAAEGGLGRPGDADGARRRRLRLGRGRRRDRPSQPRGADGDHLLDRRRRADARRRARIPLAPARPHRRQPALREDGARGRLAGDRERRREPRPLLGDPRRRRQLRRRHGVHVPRCIRSRRSSAGRRSGRSRTRTSSSPPIASGSPRRRATSPASSTSTPSRR